MKWNSLGTLVLLLLGTLLAGLAIWQLSREETAWKYAGYVGVALLLVAIAEWSWTLGLWRGWRAPPGDADARSEVDSLRRQLETQRQVLQEELRRDLQRLDQRERQLAERLVAFHQWSEYPEPLGITGEFPGGTGLAGELLAGAAGTGELLTGAAGTGAAGTGAAGTGAAGTGAAGAGRAGTGSLPAAAASAGAGRDAGTRDPSAAPSLSWEAPLALAPLNHADRVMPDEPVAELAAKDRRMLALLQRESERLFEDIRRNKYSPNGRFDVQLVRDDVFELVRKVAAIYQGEEVENPLLQTSMAEVLRAASRGCLHLLVILEQLPVKVQDYSLHRLYGYVRQGVKAYEMYKVAEPYWNNWIKPGFFLGRLALGANPVMLGAWWFVGALSAQGATAITTQLVNRQAMALLHNMVRVIGFEVASIYGGQFRYRDANWIYAAELVELVQSFALSRDSLSHALREVSGLQLRNEYDRVHFYRCLAEHRSAGPQRVPAGEVLTVDQRHALAHRLERFFKRFVKDRTPGRVRRWQEGAERRLAVPLVLGEGDQRQSLDQQRRMALTSLAAFLLTVKELAPEQLPRRLNACRLYREWSYAQQQELLEHWRQHPPLDFEPPDLPDRSPIIDPYLDDLSQLAASVAPRDGESTALAVAAAGYLGRDEAAMRRRLDDACLQQARASLPEEQRGLKLTPATARAVLDLLEDGERLRFLYAGVRIETAAGPAASTPGCSASPLPKSPLQTPDTASPPPEMPAGGDWAGGELAGGEWAGGDLAGGELAEQLANLGSSGRPDPDPGLDPEETPDGDTPSGEVHSVWLLGTDNRMVAFSLEGRPRLVWRGDSRVRAEPLRGYVTRGCRLRGGQWLDDRRKNATALLVPGPLHRRYQAFFGPLLAFCNAATASGGGS